MKSRLTPFSILLLIVLTSSAPLKAESDIDRRKAYLEQLRRILPKSAPWEAWLEKSGELPPDFEAMPSCHWLPFPLSPDAKGATITTAAQWKIRREELTALFHTWVLGTVPPKPANLEARVLSEVAETGAIDRQIELTFGPDHKAKLGVELLIPKGPGPFPIFMTQETHRSWALIALRRGYLACVYNGCDGKDDTDTFVSVYPEFDWSRLTRRAWAASRCLDYLEKIPEADVKHCVITGHSRNGKLALIASALDTRFAAVISSCSGAGGAMSARFCSEQQEAEGIEFLTRGFPDWFHPRLRFFSGREDKLPIDFHELVALSAPRSCLLSIALNDNVESSWAMQQTYLDVRPVYKLLDAEYHFRILWRPGGHETHTTIIERYVDWCDEQFGINKKAQTLAERLIHPWDWDAWSKQNADLKPIVRSPAGADVFADALLLKDGSTIKDAAGFEKKRAEVRADVEWMLGTAPPEAPNAGHYYGKEVMPVAAMLNRSKPIDEVEKEQLVFGEYINADIYMPKGLKASGKKAPVILLLHAACYSSGYVGAYRRGEPFYQRLAKQGFVVFCFDQIGTGRRIEEVEHFYERTPKWSLLGKMVRDSRAGLSALLTLPYVDTKRVFGVGYEMGAMVGLHAGALDDRFSGFAAVCAPEPFRLDTAKHNTGGLERWAKQTMWLPRLGLFIASDMAQGEVEANTPYDIHSLMASFAPRPLLIINPALDRSAKLADATKAVAAARSVYTVLGAEKNIEQLTPEDYNRFGPEMQDLVLAWLKKVTAE